jgi:molybdopterin synthase sulfur carrier subunit
MLLPSQQKNEKLLKEYYLPLVEMIMTILVKYFATYREKTGKKEEYLQGNFKTVHELIHYLKEHYDIDTDMVMVAVNRAIVPREKELSDSDEIAVFPPVSGG